MGLGLERVFFGNNFLVKAGRVSGSCLFSQSGWPLTTSVSLSRAETGGHGKP